MLETYRRPLMLAVAAMSSFLIFATTERCFERADRQNAIAFVQSLRAHPAAPTIPEALVRAHPEVSIESIGWEALLTDNYYGIVRVTAWVPTPSAPLDYVFDVNLAGQRLHPGNPRSQVLMDGLRPAP